MHASIRAAGARKLAGTPKRGLEGATQLASDGALRRLLRKAADALTAVAKLDDLGTRRLGTSS